MAVSRSSMALMSGDPGFFGFISSLAARAPTGAIGALPGGPITQLARAGLQFGQRLLSRVGTVAGPLAVGVGATALGARLAAPGALLGPSAGGIGTMDGFGVIRNKRGQPMKLVTQQGRVVNLRRRRRGISAAALSGAFRLARLCHQFGGVARTGRRRKK